MAFKLLDGATAIGASPAIKVGKNVIDHTCDVKFTSLAATAISAVTVVLQGASTNEHAVTGPITNPTLAIGSTAEQWKTGTFYYRINNVNYTKTTVAAGVAFSAAHAVTAEKYGVILCFINAAGAVSTQVVSATQAYNTAALAHAAADTYLAGIASPNKSLCYIGRILINAEAGNDWNANTDDMTNGSDLTTATFLSEPITFMDLGTNAFSAAEITAQRAMWHTTAKNVRFVRMFVSALTGTGEIDGWYTPAY
jgi:hypothetical protein